MITTQPFKVDASTLAGIIMKLWVKNHIMFLLLPPAILIFFGSLFDLRLVIVALMTIFVIIPPIMMIVYFYHALSPETRYSLLPHTLACDDTGITISYIDTDSDFPARDAEHISWSEISSIKSDSTRILITLSLSEYSLILIPKTAFDDEKKSIILKKFIAKHLRD
ncbi:MAG: hypothetical protein HDS41_06715 [Bacteroides sp.]|nr:hypothetical protein [Bacteroides sp.]